ncbi:hypothetical protein PR048_003362 [Dryococelus australis]|uniref:Uncharacterized protein n=1 Tax=Dryococelus australis TaxID=614101 RepID=A0ABQ9IMV3_9NEOP|nr:hypothetical protein PR048_003362 [Dryococelus australis]
MPPTTVYRKILFLCNIPYIDHQVLRRIVDILSRDKYVLLRIARPGMFNDDTTQSCGGLKWWETREYPEKTYQPTATTTVFPRCENPGNPAGNRTQFAFEGRQYSDCYTATAPNKAVTWRPLCPAVRRKPLEIERFPFPGRGASAAPFIVLASVCMTHAEERYVPTDRWALLSVPGGSCGAVASACASHQSDPGSITGRFAPGISHVGIVLDDAACRRVFSGYSRFPCPCIPAPLHPRVSLHVKFRDDGHLRVPAGKPVTRWTAYTTGDVRNLNPVLPLRLAGEHGWKPMCAERRQGMIGVLPDECFHACDPSLRLTVSERRDLDGSRLRAGMQGRGKGDIPEKTHRPAASSGTIPKIRKSGGNPAGNRTQFALVGGEQKLNTISACTRQEAKLKYRNHIRLERASQKQSSNTHKTPFDRVKRCRERKINIKASERANVDFKRARFIVNSLYKWSGDGMGKRSSLGMATISSCEGPSDSVVNQNDAAGRRVSSGSPVSPRTCIPALLHTHLASPSSALNISMLRMLDTKKLIILHLHQILFYLHALQCKNWMRSFCVLLVGLSSKSSNHVLKSFWKSFRQDATLNKLSLRAAQISPLYSIVNAEWLRMGWNPASKVKKRGSDTDDTNTHLYAYLRKQLFHKNADFPWRSRLVPQRSGVQRLWVRIPEWAKRRKRTGAGCMHGNVYRLLGGRRGCSRPTTRATAPKRQAASHINKWAGIVCAAWVPTHSRPL